MRISTKLVSILCTACALIFASPAFAAEESKCSGLAMVSVQESYPFQDLGFDASPGTAVTQNMVAVTCGKVTVDWWSSTGLTTDGTYGKRGGMDEHDIELTYTDSADTPIGKVSYSVYAAYFAIDLGKGLKGTDDDFAQFYAEVAKPINAGTWTVTPFARYIKTVPVGSQKGFNTLRVGGRASGPVTLPLFGEVTANSEIAHSKNGGVIPYKSVWRGDASIAKPIFWDVTGAVGVKLTEHVGTTPYVKFTRAF